MKLLKLLLALLVLNLVACSNNNSSNLALTCKNFYEGKKLYEEQNRRKENRFHPRENMHERRGNMSHRGRNMYERRGNMSHQGRNMDEKRENMSHRGRNMHERRENMPNNREKFGNHINDEQFITCRKEMNDLCGRPFEIGIKKFNSCMEQKKSSVSKVCLKIHNTLLSNSKNAKPKNKSGKRKNL